MIAVHLFQKMFNNYMKTVITQAKKIIYFSDGCATQYKNCKAFLILCYHKKDFSLDADWNFFATSHGKGPCDGLGGTVKRLVARASLQRPTADQILTPVAFYDFCCEKISNIEFGFATVGDHEEEEKLLKLRLDPAQTITGTRKFHQFIPLDNSKLAVKRFSLDLNSHTKSVVKGNQSDIRIDDVAGYITVHYDGHWYVGYVKEVDEVEEAATIQFLHPHGPSPSFVYPRRDDILIVGIQDILTLVTVNTSNGRTYEN